MADNNLKDSCIPQTDAMQQHGDTADESMTIDAGIAGEYDDGQRDKYAKAERTLTIATGVLGAMLLCGSLVLWLYFASRLIIFAPVLENWRLYESMLICCAALPLLVMLASLLLGKKATMGNWLVNMCLSGVITACFLFIVNTAVLKMPFAWADVPTTLCFSISGCALPAAVYMGARVMLERLVAGIRRDNAKSWSAVRADVLSLCGRQSSN